MKVAKKQPGRARKEPPAEARAVEVRKARKVSVSLYPADLARLVQIRRTMLDLGFRNLTDSEALRLAVRLFRNTPKAMAACYRAMQGEDLRGRREPR